VVATIVGGGGTGGGCGGERRAHPEAHAGIAS